MLLDDFRFDHGHCSSIFSTVPFSVLEIPTEVCMYPITGRCETLCAGLTRGWKDNKSIGTSLPENRGLISILKVLKMVSLWCDPTYEPRGERVICLYTNRKGDMDSNM